MEVLITYDISDKHPEVKAAMLERNFFDRWISSEKTYYLPNTTLWKKGDDVTTSSVKKEFEAVIVKINSTIPQIKDKIRIERCIVVDCSVWDGITGDKHSKQ